MMTSRFCILGSCLLLGISLLTTAVLTLASAAETLPLPTVDDAFRQSLAAGNTRQATGLVPTLPEEWAAFSRVEIATHARGVGRPASLLLSLDYLPPVRNQGAQNSCVAWSTGYYGYTYTMAKKRKLRKEQLSTEKFQFSPSFIYHLRKEQKNDGGMRLGEAFQILRQHGCATLAEMPYAEKDHTSKPGQTATDRAARYQAEDASPGVIFPTPGKSWPEKQIDPESIKTYLAEMKTPVILGLRLYNSPLPEKVKDPWLSVGKDENAVLSDSLFSSDKECVKWIVDVAITVVLGEDIWKKTADEQDRLIKANEQKICEARDQLITKIVGGHAVTIVGYDDKRKAFRMVNSWGTEWGNHGFIWLDEEYVRKFTLEAVVVLPSGPRARGGFVTIIPPANAAKP